MEKVKVAVIGGGIIGASVLYHLAKRGWANSVLLEKTVLTAGSTWHAAANGNRMNPISNVSRLQARSIDLYARLEDETGQSVGIHRPGGLMIATTNDRMDEYRATYGNGQRLGFDYRLVGSEELGEMHPLTNIDGVIGGLYEPQDGHIDPYGATHALAKGARQMGAEVRQDTAVLELHQEDDGSWRIVTDKGEIAAEWIVNAAGLWANDVAKMTGATLPMTPMEHHYLITEAMPEIEKLKTELPLIRDPDASFYMRQEQKGLLLGIYENSPKPWNPNGIPKEFGQELLQPDLDRLLPNLEKAFGRFPALENVGIKREVNGPFVFSPDGRPLIGPMPGQRNHFCAAAFLAGLNMGGGFGDLIAEWIATGRTEYDMTSCDVGRFGEWADIDYTVERAIDTYSHRYHQHYPHEERDAGRPSRTYPIYERQKANGAVFGSANGWERPLWFAPKGKEAKDVYSFARQNWFDTVGEEVAAVRNNVGMVDVSVFAKYTVTGPDASAYLDHLMACDLPKKVGRIKLAHMLDHTGGIVGEFSITLRPDGSYFLIGASMMETIHLRWMRDEIRAFDCELIAVGGDIGALSVAGPKSRELLQSLTETDLSHDAFPFLSSQTIKLGGVEVFALRVSFTGELGWELYSPVATFCDLYDTLKVAGEKFDMREFGGRAMDAMRLEKGFPRAGSEINIEVTPYEAGVAFAVSRKKTNFKGATALRETNATEDFRFMIVTVVFDDDHPIDPVANETIYHDGKIVGYITSGGYGYTIRKSLGKALIRPDIAIDGCSVKVDVLGVMRSTKVVDSAPYDPTSLKLRQ